MNERLLDIETTSTPLHDPLTPEQRAEYRRRLAEKLKDPDFRKIEGFPIGTDEAILALSDPPNYTACPNPFLIEWLEENSKPYDSITDTYHREPFVEDVSEGKNHPIYNAHSYHTKVPHRAIMRYVLHYTEPGDIIFDGFSGTGMTGVAAQLCGNKAEVEALGSDAKRLELGDYKVDDKGKIWERDSWNSDQALKLGKPNPNPLLVDPKPFSKLGPRKVVLNDLSPAATFIAHNFNNPTDKQTFQREANSILAAVEEECGWMYVTLHREATKWTDSSWNAFTAKSSVCLSQCSDITTIKKCLAELKPLSPLGRVNYFVWSDVLICPQCGGEITFWDAAVDTQGHTLLEKFLCPSCRTETNKAGCARKFTSMFDQALGKSISQAVQVPVLVNYTIGKKRIEKRVDSFDLALISTISRLPFVNDYPSDQLPDGVNTAQPRVSHGLTHTHHFYTVRNLRVLSEYRRFARAYKPFLFIFTSTHPWTTRQNRLLLSNYFGGGGGVIAPSLSGTLYVSSISLETNVLDRFALRCKSSSVDYSAIGAMIGCSSTTASCLSSSSVDYIFTDPPFGGNLNYSELSFLWEQWLGVTTNNLPEAITNSIQGKHIAEYQALMTRCFNHYYDVLKPGRWMTVEFHNSADTVWNAIHEGLQKVGFVIADVRILNKTHNTFLQVTTSGATKKDLVISCYKPSDQFTHQFSKLKGTAKGVKEFLEHHLSMLPVAPITPSGKLEQISERTLGVLFDRMIAYHLVHGALIPLNAIEFERLLGELFFKEDGMWFLPNQLAQYQARKMRGAEPEQLSFYVNDEKSAVRWIRAELEVVAQTLGELTPKFMLELKEWPKAEPRPELRDLMKEYFIQISDGTWTVPDSENEEHLSTLRRSQMLKLFRVYATDKGKFTSFRKEAVIEGFKQCWQTKQFHIIVRVSERMKPADLQADRELLQFYDIAKDMSPDTTLVNAEYVSD
jgi:DNA modification methylase